MGLGKRIRKRTFVRFSSAVSLPLAVYAATIPLFIGGWKEEGILDEFLRLGSSSNLLTISQDLKHSIETLPLRSLQYCNAAA